MLTVAGADRIVTVDLHAAQIQGYFNIPIDDLTAVPLLGHYFKNFDKENLVVVSPDHGGVTRARKLAEILNAPIAIVDKRRPRPNEVEAQNVIGDVDGKVAIVIDDICDTAGTLAAAARALIANGAKEVYAACTHGLLSGPAVSRIVDSPIKEMIITNTVRLPEEKRHEKISRCK